MSRFLTTSFIRRFSGKFLQPFPGGGDVVCQQAAGSFSVPRLDGGENFFMSLTPCQSLDDFAAWYKANRDKLVFDQKDGIYTPAK